MISAIDAGVRSASTSPPEPARRAGDHRAPSTPRLRKAPERSTSDPTSTPSSFRRTELSIRVDVQARSVHIDVVDAATKATVRTIKLGRPEDTPKDQPQLVDRRV